MPRPISDAHAIRLQGPGSRLSWASRDGPSGCRKAPPAERGIGWCENWDRGSDPALWMSLHVWACEIHQINHEQNIHTHTRTHTHTHTQKKKKKERERDGSLSSTPMCPCRAGTQNIHSLAKHMVSKCTRDIRIVFINQARTPIDNSSKASPYWPWPRDVR